MSRFLMPNKQPQDLTSHLEFANNDPADSTVQLHVEPLTPLQLLEKVKAILASQQTQGDEHGKIEG